jgi:transcriptional regulator with XRE-family HTH domain
MANQNKLKQAPPYPVERAMRRLGGNLRLARIRRGMTIEDVAKRIGTGRRAVMDAEKGKTSTGLVVFAALLWVYNELNQLEGIADPSIDRTGQSLEIAKMPTRVRKRKVLDNDF